MTQIDAAKTAVVITEGIWGKVEGRFREVGRAVLEDHKDELKLIQKLVTDAGSLANVEKHLATLNEAEAKAIEEAVKVIANDLATTNLKSKADGTDYRSTYKEAGRLRDSMKLFLEPSLIPDTPSANPTTDIDPDNDTDVEANIDTNNTAGGGSQINGQGPDLSASGQGSPNLAVELKLTPEQKKLLSEIGLTEEQLSAIITDPKYAKVKVQLGKAILAAEQELKENAGNSLEAKNARIAIMEALNGTVAGLMKTVDLSEGTKVEDKGKELVKNLRDTRNLWKEKDTAINFMLTKFEREAKDQFGSAIKAFEELVKDKEQAENALKKQDTQFATRISSISAEIDKLEISKSRLKSKTTSAVRSFGRGRDIFAGAAKLKDTVVSISETKARIDEQIAELKAEQSMLNDELNNPGSIVSNLSLEQRAALSKGIGGMFETRRQHIEKIKEFSEKENQTSGEPKTKEEAIMRVALKYCSERNIPVEGKDIRQLAWDLYNTGAFSE